MNSSKETRLATYEMIYARDGKVTTSSWLSEATPKDSPIHCDFPWDDKAAAHSHRLNLASKYILKIRPIRNEKPERVIHVKPAYPEKGEGEYLPIGTVVENEDLYARAFEELLKYQGGITRSLNDLQEAARIHDNAEGSDTLVNITLLQQAFQTAWEVARNMRAH